MARKVRARLWLNYNGAWHSAGDVFDADEKDIDAIREYVDFPDEFVSDVFPPEPELAEKPAPKRRGRPKKSAE